MNEIATQIETFAALLLEQANRARALSDEKAVDFTRRPLRIGIAPGDGIGPVIVRQAEKALRCLLQEELQSGSIALCPIEGLTIENRLEKGQSVPEDTLRQIKACPVLLKGPTTTPGGGTMTSANVTLRRELDLYANVRPVCVPDLDIDWIFFRENTEGEYTLGSRGIELEGLMAMDFKVISVAGTRRIAKAAFDYAAQHGNCKVTIVTKANIMKKTDGLFSQVCHEVAKDYPGIPVEEYYVDIMAANLVNPDLRSSFRVVLTPNLYGDILTDEAAQLQGGVGTAGSANTGSRYAMFEAIHGSAPRLIEQGLGDWADPESILRATVMLLDHIGCHDKADLLRGAIDSVKAKGLHVSQDCLTCEAFGDAVVSALQA